MKTSLDGSAFVVADAHVARAWLMGGVHSELFVVEGGAGHIHGI